MAFSNSHCACTAFDDSSGSVFSLKYESIRKCRFHFIWRFLHGFRILQLSGCSVNFDATQAPFVELVKALVEQVQSEH